MKRAIIIPDCHRPFHHVRAYNLMLEIASSVKIDELVLLGDYADFHSVSRHVKNPTLPSLLTEEVESVNEGLDQLDKLWPGIRKVYLEGNHEFRLEAFLLNHAPALFGVTEPKHLFRVPQRPGWIYQRFDRRQAYRILGSALFARHRPLATNPKTGLNRAMVSYCYGDIHKIEEARAVGLDYRSHVAFCPGWLGDEMKVAFDYMAAPPQWDLGFAFVSVDSSKNFHHEIISIKNNRAIFNGKEFRA